MSYTLKLSSSVPVKQRYVLKDRINISDIRMLNDNLSIKEGFSFWLMVVYRRNLVTRSDRLTFIAVEFFPHFHFLIIKSIYN